MLQLETIHSVSACLQTAQSLRDMADQYERRAKFLRAHRNRIEIGKPDLPAMARALIMLKNKESFPNVTASECRKISAHFLIEFEAFDRVARSAMASHKRHAAAQRAKIARAMASNGVPQIEISKRLGLSPARINEIVKPCPIALKAKRAGLSKKTYLKMKKAGRLRADLL